MSSILRILPIYIKENKFSKQNFDISSIVVKIRYYCNNYKNCTKYIIKLKLSNGSVLLRKNIAVHSGINIDVDSKQVSIRMVRHVENIII